MQVVQYTNYAQNVRDYIGNQRSDDYLWNNLSCGIIPQFISSTSEQLRLSCTTYTNRKHHDNVIIWSCRLAEVWIRRESTGGMRVWLLVGTFWLHAKHKANTFTFYTIVLSRCWLSARTSEKHTLAALEDNLVFGGWENERSNGTKCTECRSW